MLNTPNRFILPTPKWLRGHFLDKSRLYAYPTIPEPVQDNCFLILDSGAFGLSMRGEKMDFEYMHKLNEHYISSGANEKHNIIAIAPDEFLSPNATCKNFEYWLSKAYCKVYPVLQCKKKKQIDAFEIQKQCDFYSSLGIDFKFIAFSNPSLNSIQCDKSTVSLVLEIIRDFFPNAWVHNLGAGWNTLDALNWINMGFDSIDSISYYTDAMSKKKWRNDNGFTFSDEKKQFIAIHNQQIINSQCTK